MTDNTLISDGGPSSALPTSKRTQWLARLLAALFLTGSVLAGPAFLEPAHAVNTCYSQAEEAVVNNAPNKWRVKAMCKQFNAFTEARGRLDMSGCCDKETSWFRETYVWRYSSWAQGWYNRSWYETRSY